MAEKVEELDDNAETWDRVFKKVGWKQMMELTKDVDEHPEDYDGPCLCGLCKSYAAGD